MLVGGHVAQGLGGSPAYHQMFAEYEIMHCVDALLCGELLVLGGPAGEDVGEGQQRLELLQIGGPTLPTEHHQGLDSSQALVFQRKAIPKANVSLCNRSFEN